MSENDWGRPSHIFRWVMLGLLILVVLSFAVPLIFFIMRPTENFYYPFYHPFFFPFGLLFGFFVIFIVFGTLRWLFWPWGWKHRRRYWQYPDQSYNILRERYARGEITKEQYEQMMQDLQKQPHP